jgi:myo-inositol-1(or 4)-monophosphatase
VSRPSGSELSTLLARALEVAREAGAYALRGFHGRMHVSEKARADFVTEWDIGTERLIRERFAQLTPELPVFGEEEGGPASADRVWYADPIDGTTNYVRGHPFWCVSIGLYARGQPELGVVVAPALGWEWWSTSAGPASKNGAPCRVSATERIESALLATGFPRNCDSEPDSNLSSVISVKRVVPDIRRCGSAAIDLCLVADGTYDGYWERRLNLWDLTAGAAIVLGAGGRISDLSGARARLDSGQIVASNGAIHDALVGLIGVGAPINHEIAR